MKPSILSRLLLAAVLAQSTASGVAHAAVLNAEYLALGGSNWEVSFTLLADGTPASVSEFSIYVPETNFSSLVLQASPASWESLVVQPDTALPSAGYLDALLPAPAPELAAGQSQAGFVVKFSYLGSGTPGALHFDILDSSFAVVGGGSTTLVPEPSSAALSLGGVFALGLWCWRRREARACRLSGGAA